MLTAGKEKPHRERLRRHGCFSVPLLPVALVYGANASGKTNLTEAIDFLRTLVLGACRPGRAIMGPSPRRVRKPVVLLATEGAHTEVGQRRLVENCRRQPECSLIYD